MTEGKRLSMAMQRLPLGRWHRVQTFPGMTTGVLLAASLGAGFAEATVLAVVVQSNTAPGPGATCVPATPHRPHETCRWPS